MNKLEILCEKFGFNFDSDFTSIKSLFANNGKTIKEIHIDIKANDNDMLLLRSIEENVTTTMIENNLIVRRRDRAKTVIMDIPVDKIDSCVTKRYGENAEFVFILGNVRYKMFVIH